MLSKEKVLLDTDIGSDIDDAVCLAYLLAQPRCELLGITTVSGEPVARAMMADAMCKVAGKSVPIYPGCENPFLIPPRQPKAQQATALTRWPHETKFPQNQAIEFLRSTIRRHPGEITLLAIGPLTNLGVLFTVDPELPAMLKSLVLMAGRFTSVIPNLGATEWNMMCDPHAAEMVYRAPVTHHRSIGLDVTMQVQMNRDDVVKRFQHPLLKPVLDFAEVWFQHTPVITFHDPLAATTIFEPGICSYERGTVSIELESRILASYTHFDKDQGKARHEIAVAVDANRFFDHYFSVFS